MEELQQNKNEKDEEPERKIINSETTYVCMRKSFEKGLFAKPSGQFKT